jgi:hypothetical protein
MESRGIYDLEAWRRALSCTRCGGLGVVQGETRMLTDEHAYVTFVPCPACQADAPLLQEGRGT